MPRYLPFNINRNDVFIKPSQSYRSASIHKTIVKHCVEVELIDSSPYYISGFSPTIEERVFVGLCTYKSSNKQSHKLVQKWNSSTERLFAESSQTPQNGEVYMTCLDTEQKTVSYFHNGEKQSETYGDFNKIEEWHAYFDGCFAGINNAEQTHLKVNLGFTKFVNSIPEGYQPWIYGIDDVQNIHKRTCLCLRNSFIKYLTLLFSLIIK